MVSIRQQKIANELVRFLSNSCVQAANKLLHSVQILEVRLSQDLSYALIYVSCNGCQTREQAKPYLEALRKATPYLRRMIAKNIPLRIVPKLDFRFDTSEQYAQHIDNLLQKINK